MEELKVISILAKNKFGALTRVANVFARRGINIKQLTAAETTTDGVSKITILTTDVNADFFQLEKQLNRIEDVKGAITMDYSKSISKEIILIRVGYNESNLEQIQDILFAFSGKIVSFNTESLVGQVVGNTKNIEKFLDAIKEFNITEMSRSGITSLSHVDLEY